MSAVGWKLVYGGKTPPPGEVVRPDERLSWPRTVGLGTQHVVAMFGATFVFPVVMGLNPNLAILMSGVATILFLLIVKGKIPSYLGTSASFVAAVAAIRAQGGNSREVTGSILVAGLLIVVIGVIVHFAGGGVVQKVLPPAVSGAVVMLIGFNLAPVVASVYWPQDQWIGFIVMVFLVIATVIFRGFWSRIAIFLGLVLGYALSWVFDRVFGVIHSITPTSDTPVDHYRIDWSSVRSADWIGFPQKSLFAADGSETVAGWHAPSFNMTFILLVLPAVIALVAENAGHVKAVSEMTGENLDRYLGRAFIGDGVGTALASAVGGSPTTTYAENIGVMAATRVYSTAAYWVAAAVAVLLGFCPKFGAVVSATPGGVLGGVTVVLYGMIGLLGAKIWVENRVDFANPVNLIPLAAGLVAGIGGVALDFTDSFSISGIALGSIIVLVFYHCVRPFAPAHLREGLQEPNRIPEGRAADAVVVPGTAETQGDDRR
ncbi:solute carrier family 23 protein [Rhodococcus sp. X156]|uniref:uracil-xanthine permease family protein n=1 Tax=Rhodococcus sp. X156 TaxID=2499145 RepID=UPI000FDA2D69|nr:solute carrier family 23 protein [Rhodococcus sp. X156]